VRLAAGAGRIVAVLLVAIFSACGKGSGGMQSTTAVSTHSLSFSAVSPDAPTPTAQTFSATFSGDTVYITVLGSGKAVGNVALTRSGNSSQVTVTPAAPSSIGAGVFSGIVSVTGFNCANADCTLQARGNTETINLTYSIPPIVRAAAPYVATSSVAGDVVVRGRGFAQFPVQNVTFGATAASIFSVISDTEIHASYPALAAGTYAVQIDAPTSPGAIVSTANLVVVDPPNYATTALAYPSASVQIERLLYDAEHGALLVARTTASGGEIVRYAFSGGTWGSANTTPVADLADIALSTNGQELLALGQSTLTSFDPTTLVAGAATPTPALAAGNSVKNLAVPNDDNAIITTGRTDNAASALYLYTVYNRTYAASTTSLVNATPAASGNGALVVLTQGDPTQAGSAAVFQYPASSGTFTATGVGLNQNSIAPALDRAVTRVVLNGTQVYGASYTLSGTLPSTTPVVTVEYTLLGTLPSTTLAVAVKPDGTRAYTLDSVASEVLSFDLTGSAGGAALPQVGSGTTLAADPGAGTQMAISPDGGTLFLAGADRVVVQPAPP
jgi:IPT/TIG domain